MTSPMWFRRVTGWGRKTAVRMRAEGGASLVEYAFLAALIAMVCIVAVVFLGEQTSVRYSSVSGSISAAGN